MKSIQGTIFSRLILINSIFFLFIAVVVAYVADRFVEDFVIQDRKNTLVMVTNNIYSNYHAQLRVLEELAIAEGFSTLNLAKSVESTKNFFRFERIYSTIHVYKPSGQVFFTLRRDGTPSYKQTRTIFSDHPKNFAALFHQVLREKRPLISETFTTSNGNLFQTYIVPVINKKSGLVTAVISGGIFPHHRDINHLFKGLNLSEANFLLISDRAGNIIASANSSDSAAEQVVSKEIMEYYKYGPGTQTKGNNVWYIREEPDYVMISYRIKGLTLTATLAVHKKIIYQTRNKIIRYLISTYLFCFIFIIAISRYTSKRLALPIEDMGKYIKDINRGKYEALSLSDRDDELAEYVKQLDQIRAKIVKDKTLGHLWSERMRDDVK